MVEIVLKLYWVRLADQVSSEVWGFLHFSIKISEPDFIELLLSLLLNGFFGHFQGLLLRGETALQFEEILNHQIKLTLNLSIDRGVLRPDFIDPPSYVLL